MISTSFVPKPVVSGASTPQAPLSVHSIRTRSASAAQVTVTLPPSWLKAPGYAKITRDLNERRRSAETLAESEERFRLLVEGIADEAIYMLDPKGHISS